MSSMLIFISGTFGVNDKDRGQIIDGNGVKTYSLYKALLVFSPDIVPAKLDNKLDIMLTETNTHSGHHADDAGVKGRLQ
jgi:hypothetical protein